MNARTSDAPHSVRCCSTSLAGAMKCKGMENLSVYAVKTGKEESKTKFQRPGHADDRPVAETPCHPGEGCREKGGRQVPTFSGAWRESCDLKCTGCEPSLVGRATTGPMARYERSMCRKPLHLIFNPQWPDGAEGSRTEPEGLLSAFWWGDLPDRRLGRGCDVVHAILHG